MTGKPDSTADWRGKIYDAATHQWIDAEPAGLPDRQAPAAPAPAPAQTKARAARFTPESDVE